MQKRGIFEFLDKKGTLALRQSLIHLGMIVLAGIVFYLLVSYVQSIEKNANFEMTFFSRDLALLTNTLYAAQGDVDYTYSSDELPLSTFNFKFKTLNEQDDKPIVNVQFEGASKEYPYAKHIQDTDIFSIPAPKEIKFSKKENKIKITKIDDFTAEKFVPKGGSMGGAGASYNTK